MDNTTHELDNKTEVNVTVKAVLSEQGVDINVDSDVDTPTTATALFLGLMATYEVAEEDATKIFETMSNMVEEFKNKGEGKHGRYID